MYYDILKASKVKAEVFPDYWTLLWGRKMSASMIKTITGVLPLTFTAKGGTAADWVISGNDDMGENHWHQNAYSTTINDVSISADTSSLTVSSNGSSATISATDDVWKNAIKTLIGSGEYTYQYAITGTHTNMAIGFYKSDNTSVFTSNKNTYSGTFTSDSAEYYNGFYLPKGWSGNITVTQMLVKGSTAPDHYIPYQQGVGERTENIADVSKSGMVQINVGGDMRYGLSLGKLEPGDYTVIYTSNLVMYTTKRLSNNTYTSAPAPSRTVITITSNIDELIFRTTSSTETTWEAVGVSNIMIVKGSIAPDHYIPYGYQIPLTVSQQGQTDKTYDIYIGDTPLTEGETVSKTSTGVDVELFEGSNTVDTTLYNKPTMEIKYK